jgi:hypothetical protein
MIATLAFGINDPGQITGTVRKQYRATWIFV